LVKLQRPPPEIRIFLPAFSLDAMLLWERGEHLLAAYYVGGSVALSIVGLALGLWVMRTALA